MSIFYQKKVFKDSILLLNKMIAGWGEDAVLVYGAGEHSRHLLENISWGSAKFIGFIDRSTSVCKREFIGFPVYSPDAITNIGATKIIISSFSFQEEIYNELIKKGLNGIDIIKIYTEDVLLKDIKDRYAYCPKADTVRDGLLRDKDRYILPIKNKESLKILLIQPPFPIANHRHKKILPMNLLYIAGYLKKHNSRAEVRVLDGQGNDLSLSEIKALIGTEAWDIIGIGYWTAQSPSAFTLSKFIRDNTKALLIHGGVHPTICSDEAAPYCDIVIKNEGEITMSEIVRAFPDMEKILNLDGIAYLGKDGLKENNPSPAIDNLDAIPFPAFEIIPDITVYNAPMHVTGGLRVPLIGSRGCPYSCTFCSSPIMWGKHVRWRSPVNVTDEMEYVMKNVGITQFHFWDDNLMLKADYIKGICENIIKRGLKINWCGLTRASHVNKHKDILPLMREAGCVGIEIGIESFTEDSISMVRKGEGLNEMISASINMEKAGIVPLYTHMFFNPGEDINGYIQKQRFLDEINKKNSHYLADSRLGQAATPHKKTEFERCAAELGYVAIDDLSKYFHHRINFIPNSLLEDIPVKVSNKPVSYLIFLEVILNALFDWDEEMVNAYITVYDKLWGKIDGLKSVRTLCDEILAEMRLSQYKSKVLTSMAIVGLARGGSIGSKKINQCI